MWLTAIKWEDAEKCVVSTQPRKPELQMAVVQLPSQQQTCALATRGRACGVCYSSSHCYVPAKASKTGKDNRQPYLRFRMGEAGYRGKTQPHKCYWIPKEYKRHFQKPLLLSSAAPSPGQTAWTHTPWCAWVDTVNFNEMKSPCSSIGSQAEVRECFSTELS